MKRLCFKFGGSSLGTVEKIRKVANIIKNRFSEGNEIIVVVSAMSGVTDELKAKSDLISKNFDNKELDVLLSSGEQVSCSLLSGALIDLGVKARSWLGWQIPIVTNDNYTSSQIIKIKTEEILNFISKKGIAVIAGFQGISKESRITTLGRGGSDLTAVAIAKFFETDSCEIYTDVEGVLTTDPLIHNQAKKIDKISYEEMLELAEPVEPVEVPEVSAPKLLIERLREAREKVSQTIEGMALLLQVSPEYYEQIEEGKTIPEEELLKRIASLFEWNYHELLEEDRRSRFIHFQSSDRPLGIRSRSDSERELNEVLRIIREGWNELRPDQQRSLLNQLELIRDTLQLWQGMVSRPSEEPSDT